jgi:hypothetical protein
MNKIKPKKYYTLKEEFGEDVAEVFLSKCTKLEPMFTGPVTYRVTREAHQYALTIATGKSFAERETERLAKINWDEVNRIVAE